MQVRMELSTSQHKRNRDIIREIVEHTIKLEGDVEKMFDDWREDYAWDSNNRRRFNMDN